MRVVFSPDGQTFLGGDGSGGILLHSRDGELLAKALAAKSERSGRWVAAIAWSPDGEHVATLEWRCLRLRRADDLTVVAEVPERQFGRLAFADSGRCLAIADRVLQLRSVPSLAAIATLPLERIECTQFDIVSIAADPTSSLLFIADSGGRDSDDDDRTTYSDPAQTTIFDVEKRAVVSVVDGGVLPYAVRFDPWRRRMYTLSYERGLGVWTPAGELVHRFHPYESRRSKDGRYVPPAHSLAVSERWLATMTDDTKPTIDLWDPSSFAHLASADVPKGEMPAWLEASPDGSLLVAPTKSPARRFGVCPLRLWHVRGGI